MNDELVALTEAATELVSNQPGYAIKCQQKDDGTVEVIEWGEGITPPSDSDLATKKAEKLAKIVNNKYIQADILSWGSKGISPSALNKYIKCSLDFYYHYLAEIKTSNLVQEFADNSLMGNAIHLSLKELYPIGELSLKNFEYIFV